MALMTFKGVTLYVWKDCNAEENEDITLKL